MRELPETQKVRITQRDAVGWFDPRALFTSALKVVASALVGERTGRREILAALDTPIQLPKTPHLISRGPEGYHDHSKEVEKGGESGGEEKDAFWFDYVADLGDGFNATHSVAWLIGRDYVYLKNKGEEVVQPLPPAPNQECGVDALGPGYEALPAGSVLVMGGDQVYPFASADNYRERLYEPYFAARPWGHPQAHADPMGGRRALYAIPGNHDWYDGLASFIRQFCQPNRWIGCWQAQQKRSYFALKLPHSVWLWAIDTALEDDIDPPQVDFFEKHAALIQPNERLILVVPYPAWLKCVSGQARDESDYDPSWRKLRKIISIVTEHESLGPENVPLIITGDCHHYAHYKETGQNHDLHLFTCGIGGAYMLGTARLPTTLHCENGRAASLQKPTFPTVEESRNLRWGVFKFALRYKFSNVLIALGLLLTVWFMRSAPHYFEPCTEGLLAKLSAVWGAIEWPPSALAIAISIIVFLGFAKPRDANGQPAWKWVTAGLLHALAQLSVAHWIVELAFCFVRSFGFKGFAVTLVALPVSFVVCVLATGMLFPLYLMAANKIFGLHDEELYSSQAIEKYKGFMRIKITPKEICVYPIGLTKICESWVPAYAPAAPKARAPFLEGLRGAAMRQFEKAREMLPEAIRVRAMEVEMANDTSHLFNPGKPLAAHLIEGPISIPLPGGGSTKREA